MTKLTIKEGIELSVITDSRFKTFSAGVYIHLPLLRESAAKNALLPMVQKSGSALFPDSAAINRRLEFLYGAKLGASSQKLGETQVIGYTLNAVSDRFVPRGEKVGAEAFALLGDIAFNPLYEGGGFFKTHVEREKEALRDIIEGQMNDKRRYAAIRLIDNMCEGEAYGTRQYGRVEDLTGIGAGDLAAQYESIIQTAPIDIIVAGNIEREDAIEFSKGLVSSLKGREGVYPGTKTLYLDNKIKYVNEDMDVAQGKLAIGCRTGVAAEDEQYYHLLVANEIFGGSPASKLFNNVRERLSLCYYISSVVDRMKGIMMISAGIEADSRRAALDEIFAQARDMAEGRVSEEELAAAKASLINNFRLYEDDVDTLLAYYASLAGLSGAPSPGEAAKLVEKVTMDEVVAVSGRLRFDTVYFLGKGGGEN